MSNELFQKMSNEIYLETENGKIHLNSIKSIWSYLGLDVTLSQSDLSKINKSITSINKNILKTNELINEIYIDQFIDDSQLISNSFQELYNIIKKDSKIIKDIISRIKNEKNIKDKLLYYRNDEKIWLEKLVNIYLNEGGKLPILSLDFFKYFKLKWKDIFLEKDKQFVIYVCEDILGGLNLENISYNFNTWIKRNITDRRILNDFYIY